MKLVTFEVATVLGRFSRLGVLWETEDVILDLHAAYQWWLREQGITTSQRIAQAVVPPDLRGLIEGGTHSLEQARQVVSAVQATWDVQEAARYKGKNGENLLFHRSMVRLKPPLPQPNSLRDFLAFEAHTKKGYERRGQTIPEQWYKMPVYYKGNHRSLIGPDEAVVWPRYTQKLDYELEWACVIGQEGRDIPEAEAEAFIFGYMILNDFSARDIQMEEMVCRLGPAKGKDFATAVGPYLVTADEIPDPRNLRMIARVNGEVWSEGNTGTSHWTWAQMIAHVSNEETVYPSDILGSGTVGGGCGYELDRWIQPGDVVELEIEGLGQLRTPIVTHEQSKRPHSEPERQRNHVYSTEGTKY